MKARNMIGSMLTAMLWGTLLGNPAAGVAVASVSGTERDGKIREESGVHQLRELLATATMARTRLARASGYEDPVKRIPMKIVVICLTAVAGLALAIVIAAATSSRSEQNLLLGRIARQEILFCFGSRKIRLATASTAVLGRVSDFEGLDGSFSVIARR